MTLAQKLATTAIMFAYVGEAFGKFYIFFKRFNNPNIPNLKTEQIIYFGSVVTDWLRSLELLSLSVNIIGWPVGFLSISIFSWFYWIPISSNPFIIYLLIALLLFLAISWDIRYGIGGVTVMQPFKNYLNHSEGDDDKNTALISFFGSFCILVLIYGLLQIIQSL